MEEKLTKEQIEAISHFEGPAIVIAGPGSGKTRIITERVKYLISKKNINPSNILVTTFTEKASNELKHRLFTQIGKNSEQVHISTIHSFCKSLMEEFFYCHEFGIDFSVLDEDNQGLLILANKNRLNLGGIKGWRDLIIHSAGYNSIYENLVGRLYNFITENDIDIEEVKKDLIKKNKLTHDMERILDSYNIYVRILKEENTVDFPHLEKTVYYMLKDNKEVLNQIKKKIKFILVDEYQDTNPVQDFIFKKIAGNEQNIFVVGDENQSIYGFRGATIENFITFTRVYKNAKKYFLNTNFRSTDKIVDAANKINKKFKNKIEKKLIAYRGKGNNIVIIRGETRKDSFLNTVKYLKARKIPFNDTAFLYRKRALADDLIWALNQENIPFQTDSDGKFFERPEIREFVTLFRYIYQDQISESDFKGWKDWWSPELFNNEVIKISDESLNVLNKLPRDTKLNEMNKIGDLLKTGIKNVQDAENIAKIHQLRVDINDKKKGLLDSLFELFKISKYLSKLLNESCTENEESLYNLARLTQLLYYYEIRFKRPTAKGFLYLLYNNSRVKSLDQVLLNNKEAVKCMTAHKAKGLEFPVVVLCSMAEGDFPLNYKNNTEICGIPFDKKFVKSSNLHIDESNHYNEELRLFYVAITRAQDLLILTVPEKVTRNKLTPSRFLDLINDYVTEDIQKDINIEMHYRSDRDIPTLSYTSVNTYMDCPFRYKIDYIYQFFSPSGPLQRHGIIIHNILQRINIALKNKEKVDKKKIEEFLNQYWMPITGKKKDESFKKETIEFIYQYYLYAKENYKEIISIEESFTYIDDNMIVKGKTDLIVKDKEGNKVLMDFKARTSKGIEEISVDNQLNIYNFCLSNNAFNKLIAYTVLDSKVHDFAINKKSANNILQNVSNKLKDEVFNLNQDSVFCKSKQCVYGFICKELKNGKYKKI